MDLSPFISKSQCECLNESDDHPLANCLTSTGGFLQSDCDEQVNKDFPIFRFSNIQIFYFIAYYQYNI